ncbi:MAG: hypothetical protein WC612_05655 [Bdellovibrionales bacterium]|jgi:Ni/Co efflux regulator RcnB
MKPLKFVLGMMLLSSLLVSPAFARNDRSSYQPTRMQNVSQRDRDDNGDRGDNRQERGGPSDRAMRFEDQKAEHIRVYMREHYRNHCPPGLAKKHNGCQAPGQARKTYVIGGYIPSRHYEVPYNLLNVIGPPPRGTYYAMVDSDVLLVSEATKKILDAVVLLSAVQ